MKLSSLSKKLTISAFLTIAAGTPSLLAQQPTGTGSATCVNSGKTKT